MKVAFLFSFVFLSAWADACSCLGRNDLANTYQQTEVTVMVEYLGATYPEVDSETLELEKELGLDSSLSIPLGLMFKVLDEFKGAVGNSEFEIGTASFCAHIGTLSKSLIAGETYILMLDKHSEGTLSLPGCSEYFVRVTNEYIYRFKYSNGEYYERPVMSKPEFLDYLNSNK